MDPIALLDSAEKLIATDKPARALPFLDRAARAGGDRFFRADVLHRRAEALRALGRFEEALRDYRRAQALYRRSGVTSERVRALLGASACLRVLSRYEEAARICSSAARPPSRGSGAGSLAEEILLERALVERGLGKMGAAARLLRAVIPKLEKRRDREALQHAWWALAGAERFSGCYGRALASFVKARGLARLNGDPSAEAYAWCGEAGCLRILGAGGGSLRKYRDAHAFFHRSKDLFGEAYGFCGMANALRTYGDPRKALPLYVRSAALYTKVGDVGSRAFAFWGLGGGHRRLGKFGAAAGWYRRALNGFKKVGDHRGVIMALLGLGRTAGESLRPGARGFLDQALSLARRERHPYEAALARMELSRLAGRVPDPALFRPFGIAPGAVRRWKDLP